jgi:Uma2 family endonuclease
MMLVSGEKSERLAKNDMQATTTAPIDEQLRPLKVGPPRPRPQPEIGGADLDGPLVLSMRPPAKLTEDQFIAFCQQNPDLRIERTAGGDLIIMSPTKDDAGIKNAELTHQLTGWANADGTGRPFDSSAGFDLPNGATRSPDASWVRRSRLAALPPTKRPRFIPLCPDFVVELRSSTDRLPPIKNKMKEYMANGAQLGWLLDPRHRRVYIYRPSLPEERLDNPATLSGDPLLPGFVLDVQRVFDATF